MWGLLDLAVYGIILVAGRGERLWPLTSTRPKPLLPLPGGDTLLSRVVKLLRGVVDGFIFVVGYLGDLVRWYVDNILGVPCYYVFQEVQRGTGDAVRLAFDRLPRGVDLVVVVYGDLMFDRGIVARVRECIEDGVNCVVGVWRDDPWNYGVLFVDGRGRLERVVEKPSREIVSGRSLVNAGVYVFRVDELSGVLDKLKPSIRGEYELTDALNMLASTGSVKVVGFEGFWADVGRPWDYLDSVRWLIESSLGGEQVVEGEVEPGARLVGPVYVGRNAVVRSYSVVEGPAWIEGEVGPLTHVRSGTFVASKAKLGAFTQVKSSIVLEDARASHLNYVGDSIVGEKANLGAGTITANLRFDRKPVKTVLKGELVSTGRVKFGSVVGGYASLGINVSILPGRKVGAWSWVYPGIVVDRDVPDCSYLRPSEAGKPAIVERGDREVCNPIKAYKELIASLRE